MDILYIDGHNDTMMRVLDGNTKLPTVDIGGHTRFHIDIEKLKKGKLSAPVFSAFSEGYFDGRQNIEKSLSESLSIINALYFTEKNNEDSFKIVDSVQDITENFGDGKISAIPSIEGAYFIDEENHIEMLKQMKDLKIKILGFNWNHANCLGVGAGETYSDGKTPASGGITQLGIRVLKEMEKLGIGIDVSHMNEETFWGVVENTESPIIATHSGVYNLREHRRNLKDSQLHAIKESGGIVGIVLCSSFLKDEGADLDDYMNHLHYAVDLIGPEHVAIGSDLDGTTLPMGVKDSSEMYKIIDRLKEKYSHEDVEKIISGNFLRVFKELEKNEEKNYLDGIKIETAYEMGDLKEKNEVLKAHIGETKLKIRIIIDGIETAKFTNEFNEIDFDFDIKNEEQFHVLTIELEKDGKTFRDTKILRIK